MTSDPWWSRSCEGETQLYTVPRGEDIYGEEEEEETIREIDFD
jgi:hypothetical protein